MDVQGIIRFFLPFILEFSELIQYIFSIYVSQIIKFLLYIWFFVTIILCWFWENFSSLGSNNISCCSWWGNTSGRKLITNFLTVLGFYKLMQSIDFQFDFFSFLRPIQIFITLSSLLDLALGRMLNCRLITLNA